MLKTVCLCPKDASVTPFVKADKKYGLDKTGLA